MTLLGSFALWLALVTALTGAVLAFSGRWRSRPELAATVLRSAYAVCAALVVASLALWQGLLTHDFNIEYVAAYTSRNLPTAYVITAFWAGQKGSLLFWALVLSVFAALALATASRDEPPLKGPPHVATERRKNDVALASRFACFSPPRWMRSGSPDCSRDRWSRTSRSAR
ncbi:MAG: hypothetical protein K6U89_13875 [Chloroflexi bacterium]|nr:hypothetical protein [Chloroflexota bacterium]